MNRINVYSHLASGFGDALVSALEYRDSETFLHSERVVNLAQDFGKHLKLTPTQLETLWAASIFHDVGKVGISDSILKKPGKLDAQEWEVMKSHASIGGDIIHNMDSKRAANLARIVRHHH